jgi:putative ABC transport system permease protein
MNSLTLVWANLWRKPVRTVLTALSIAMAFLLIGLLQGVNAGFAEAIAKARRDVLTTDPRLRGSPPMPIAMLEQIRKVPGVADVAPRAYFMGDYRTPYTIAAIATLPRSWFELRRQFRVEESALQALERTRNGMLITPAMIKQFGWKVGDQLTLRSRELKADGSGDWSFEIVGIFEALNDPDNAFFTLIDYSYLDDTRITNRGTVDRFFVRVADPERSIATAAAIDALFTNSSHQTRTRSDQDRAEAESKRMGDIGFFTQAVLGAVLFMLLFLTANITRQSFQERITEFGVLKALGFSNGACLRLALAESICIYLPAAAAGLALASLLTPLAREIHSAVQVTGTVYLRGMTLALALAIASAAFPCWQAYRLSVARALSARIS